LKTLSSEKKQSRSSDRPLYYIYKYKEETPDGYNYTRYARDRHGITCCVDNAFRENDEAYTHFLKKIKPIYPDKCKPEDTNIDHIRIKNCEKSKEDISRHYLVPCVEEPYLAQKYSRRRNSTAGEVQT
jgi:hypothetical protein